MGSRLRAESHKTASASASGVLRPNARRRARPARAVLETLAASPYRDAAAATFAAVGSLALVKSLEQLAARGVLEGVRSLASLALVPVALPWWGLFPSLFRLYPERDAPCLRMR